MKIEDIKRLVEANANRIAAQKRKELKEKLESNAEYQRKSRMTKEERAREAIEHTAKGVKEYNDFKAGRDTPFEAAMEKARQLARKADVDNEK